MKGEKNAWVTLADTHFLYSLLAGRIDQAHHDGRAYMALHETVALDNAVAKSLQLTNEQETLTIVTADHSHPLSHNGFPFRGQSILGNYETFIYSSKIFGRYLQLRVHWFS